MRNGFVFGTILVFILSFQLAFSVDLNLSIVGEDNIEGIREPRDTLVFYMNFSGIEASEFPSSFQRIKINDYDVSDSVSCDPIESDAFACTYYDIETYTTSSYVDYTVKLQKSDGSVLVSKRERVYVDGLGPKITSVKGIPDVIKSEDSFNLTVSAREMSVEGSGFCAGFDHIAIYQPESSAPETPTLEKDIDVSGCVITKESIEVDGSLLSTDELCVAGVDKMGHVSDESVCNYIVVDDEPPEIMGGALYYKNKPLRYVKPDTLYNVNAKINISENGDLDSSKVIGNFSSISSSYSSLKPDKCDKVGKDEERIVYQCEWNGLSLKLHEERELFAYINITDEAGNSASGRVDFNVGFDSQPPQISGLTSSYGQYNGMNYLGENNVIILYITDDQSGISPENVFIDASDIEASNKISADYCDDEACYFENVKPGLGDGEGGEIVVKKETHDNAGNTFDDYYGAGFLVDKRPPKIINLSFMSSTGLRELNGGDSLVVTVYANDSTQTYIGGDFSNVSNAKIEESECESTDKDNLWKCILTVPDLIAGADGTVLYYIRDFVNNSVEKTAEVSVNIPYYSPKPDFWQLERVEVSEPGLDAEVSKVIEQYVVVNFVFQRKVASAELVEMKVDSCSGADFVDFDVMPFNGDKGEVKVPVVMRVGEGELEPGKLDVKCRLELYTKYKGNQLTKSSEVENAEFEIKVYEGITGLSSSDMTQKIKDKYNFVNSWFGWLDPLMNIYYVFKDACGIANPVVSSNAAVNGVIMVVENIPGLEWTGLIAGASNKLTDYLAKIIAPICNWVSCRNRTVEGSDWWHEWLNSVNEMGLHDFGTPSPGDSILYDLTTGCLPGVLERVYSALEIECARLDCYGHSLENGYPITYCDDLANFAWCEKVVGEIYSVVPFAVAIDQIYDGVKTWISNPISFLGGLFSLICHSAYRQADVCTHSHALDQIGKVIVLLNAEYKNWNDLQERMNGANSYCQEVLDKYSSYVD